LYLELFAAIFVKKGQMLFKDILELIPKIRIIALPGEVAQLKMAPPERALLMQKKNLIQRPPRQAAVSLILYPEQESAHLILIMRNDYKGVHSSQIAFPGGKIETQDSSAWTAAVRETSEEIGVSLTDDQLVCALSPVYIPPSNFLVHPFLCYCLVKPSFVPDPREVSKVLSFSIESLLNDESMTSILMDTAYSKNIGVPGFKYQDGIIWGATAMILSELKEVLKCC
jgi:8-oxo-dGTP pyrophosphatase MutT (NUDIX family)